MTHIVIYDRTRFQPLVDDIKTAVINNDVDNFEIHGQKLFDMMTLPEISKTSKLNVLSYVNQFVPFEKQHRQALKLPILQAKFNLLKRCYISLFDRNNFRQNEPVLRFFFESATRIGTERDMLLDYCIEIIPQLNYAEKQILVDIMPYCKKKEKLMKELRRYYELNPPIALDIRTKKPITYTQDAQSVHFSGIARRVNQTRDEWNKNDIADKYEEMVNEFVQSVVITDKVQKAISIITMDSTVNLKNVFCQIWTRIVASKHKDELIQRLVEELTDAYNTCYSGHLSRLMNVLSGFEDQSTIIGIDYKEEIHASFLAKFHTKYVQLGEDILVDPKDPEYIVFKNKVYQEICDTLYLEYKPLFNDKFGEKEFQNALKECFELV